jgi:hypothetical protein
MKKGNLGVVEPLGDDCHLGMTSLGYATIKVLSDFQFKHYISLSVI